MLSGRFPPPQLVSCSSFIDQNHHCYKAFDGDVSSSSSWRTQTIGQSSNPSARGPPQWIVFDFGAGRSFYPTAIDIVCGKSSATVTTGCPSSFVLMGSVDLMNFDVLVSKEYISQEEYQYNSFHYSLFSESPHGRPNGQSCGSCERPPFYSCEVESYDASCSSKYCGYGVCEMLPLCPPGFYRSISSMGSFVITQCLPCPLGVFGSSAGLSDPLCSGLCSAGYYCGLGSTSATQNICGDRSFYCPEGSGAPVSTPSGWMGVISNTTFREIRDGQQLFAIASITICPRGSFCVDGAQNPCPPGQYGNTEGLQTSYCTGACLPGTYCPSGSIEPLSCPFGSFCPDGIEHIPCPSGHYGASSNLTDRYCSGLCSPGFYCNEGSSSSTSIPCPGGVYGDQFGLVDETCSGPCIAGYFCPPGSSNTTLRPCGGVNFFCPYGSQAPAQVAVGFYSVGIGNEVHGSILNRVAQKICEPGYFCVLGVKYPCPGGTFGNISGLSSNDTLFSICSGLCPPGHYCVQGSSAPSACPAGTFGIAAGLTGPICSGVCPLGHYCPLGAIRPLPCPGGIFGNCTGATDSTCRGGDGCYSPAGFNVVQELLVPLSLDYNLCHEGYYCPEGSMSSRQYECGGFNVFCPRGSASPTQVSTGYYSTSLAEGSLASSGMIQSSQTVCEVGYFCAAGVKAPCPPGTVGSSEGLSSSLCSAPCPPGHYCLSGSAALFGPGESITYLNSRIQRCPGGTYGNSPGLSLIYCSGQCSAGYFCPPGSTSSEQNMCGGANFYCPLSSSAPIPISLGYFSVSSLNDSKRATSEIPCAPGYYCVNGIAYLCPAGSFGQTSMLSSPSCSGLCAKGFYCPAGSTSSMQIPCPAGTYGSQNGLTNSSCSGYCLHPLQCPIGTFLKPQP